MSAKILTYKERVESSELLIDRVLSNGAPFVLAHSLGLGASVVYDLLKKRLPMELRLEEDLRPFIVVTRHMPKDIAGVLERAKVLIPNLVVVENVRRMQRGLNSLNKNRCCHNLKILPSARVINELRVGIWFTGMFRSGKNGFRRIRELEDEDTRLLRVNPIWSWDDFDVHQYLEENKVEVIDGHWLLDCVGCDTDLVSVLRWTDGVKSCGGCGNRGR